MGHFLSRGSAMIQTPRLSPATASRLLCVGRGSAPADALAMRLDPAVPSIPGRGLPSGQQPLAPDSPASPSRVPGLDCSPSPRVIESPKESRWKRS